MFRFAYAKVNDGMTAAACCAEAASSCTAANTAAMNANIAMDAALAASILLCLRVLGLSIYGVIIGMIIIISHRHLAKRKRGY